MLSRTLQSSISRALKHAAALGEEYSGPEHLLLALLDERNIAGLIIRTGGTPERLRHKLESYLSERSTAPIETARPSPPLARVLERAILLSQKLERKAGVREALGVMLSEPDSYAARLLCEEGLNYVDLIAQIMVTSDGFTSVASSDAPALVGREREVARLLEVLSASHRSSALLVGEPGVGKTALLQHVVRMREKGGGLVAGEVLTLKSALLVSDMQNPVELEQRFRRVVKECKEKARSILLLDDLAVLLRLAAARSLPLDVFLFEPLLGETGVRCVATLTEADRRHLFEREPLLTRLFQVITVGEPDPAEALPILRAVAPRLAAFHQVEYTEAALRAAADAASGARSDRRSPQAALDLLERAAGLVKRRPGALQAGRPRRITARDVSAVAVTAEPGAAPRLDGRERGQLKRLEDDLRSRIFGQDPAIARVAEAVRINRAGLGAPGRPVGCFLFAGPSGVGKTELARQLAATLGLALIRFDMSEYLERHSVSRLIGAPPGYVGYDRGGLLTSAVRDRPRSVLLLDEIEKAHPDICNLLLQVMDHGCLRESSGLQADFRQSIIILTSNVGAAEGPARTPGFQVGAAPGPGDNEVYRRIFSPEFRNRLDAKIDFAPLQPVHVAQIVDRSIDDWQGRLAGRRTVLEVTPAARARLAQEGYHPASGARPLERLLRTTLIRPLGDELLFGRLVRGGTVLVDCREGELVLEVRARAPGRARA